MAQTTAKSARPGTPSCGCPWAGDPELDANGEDVGIHLDGCPHQPWTLRSPEERQRILDTLITFGYIGGRSHAGSGVFESWLPGDRPGKKSAVVQSNERFSPDTEDPKGDE